MIAQIEFRGWAEHMPLCPGISDINLSAIARAFVYLDAEISDLAFDLGVAE